MIFSICEKYLLCRLIFNTPNIFEDRFWWGDSGLSRDVGVPVTLMRILLIVQVAGCCIVRSSVRLPGMATFFCGVRDFLTGCSDNMDVSVKSKIAKLLLFVF